MPLRHLAPVLLLLLAPLDAHAFCGFYVGGAETSLYNDATMVVMMREGTRTVLSMQNSYQGPPEGFAMVVPVPMVLQRENVQTLPDAVFARVDQLAAPRLVEYWEQDPCYRPPSIRRRVARTSMARPMAMASGSGRAESLGVRVEAQFEVGEYDIVVLSAEDSGGLDTWLREEGYRIPAGAETALRPYVESGTKFFVARVDPSRVSFQNGRAMLSPLRVHYDSDTFSLPVRLGLINSNGTQDLIVHVLGRNQRYEVANYRNAFVPTNLRVRNRVRDDFGSFYAALFDKTLEVNPGAVVTEYAWQAGSCDPCPGPTLTDADIMTLGGDVVGSGSGQPAPSMRGRGGWGGLAQQYTLTRLHYRYGRGGLDEDLVFRTAGAVVGGRGEPNRGGRMAQGVARSSGANNFQGRYAILHRWSGPIECEHPRRGVWGGPPGGGGGHSPSSATNLGSQARPNVPVQRYLVGGRLPAQLQSRGGGGRGAEPMTPTASAEVAEPSTAAATIAGCSVTGRSSAALAALIGLAALGLVVRRRR